MVTRGILSHNDVGERRFVMKSYDFFLKYFTTIAGTVEPLLAVK